jgi:hypothetical protein
MKSRAESDRRYQQSVKGRTRSARYERSAKGHVRTYRYAQSLKGFERDFRRESKDRTARIAEFQGIFDQYEKIMGTDDPFAVFLHPEKMPQVEALLAGRRFTL